MKEDPVNIIPVLLPGAAFVEVLDIEAIKPTMRADRVFKVQYRGQSHILDIEFETGTDDKIRARLLAYSAILYLEYAIPVIPLIVYPFRTTIAHSPLRIESGDGETLIFPFHTLPLFSLEAEQYIQKHLTCMYPLLPAMSGANADVLAQAMAELAELYREDEVSLSQQFIWMELLLGRTTTISEEEKAKIQEGIKMYDPLWEEHPKVKKIKAEAKAKAKAEAEAAKAKAEAESRMREATANTLRDDVIKIVQARFPELAEVAQQAVSQLSSPDALNHLLVQVASASNTTAARYILHPSAA